MTTEIDGQFYYSGENFDTPDWWDKLLKKILKKKGRIFSRRIKQQEED